MTLSQAKQTAEVEDLLARSRPDRVVIEAWKWRHIKRKTDRDDALKLARLSLTRGSRW